MTYVDVTNNAEFTWIVDFSPNKKQIFQTSNNNNKYYEAKCCTWCNSVICLV